MIGRITAFLIVFFALAGESNGQSRATISLAGQWRFALDPQDGGIRDRFFGASLADSIQLPGSLQEQGFGAGPSMESNWVVNDSSLAAFKNDPKYAPYREAGNFKSPCWLTPKHHYVGPAWYQREIEIPAGWAGKRVVLHLERPHWQSAVWVDEHEIGRQDSLGTPHDYELGEFATPGKHRLTIRIDNRLNIPVGPHAHSVTDMSQTNWNGIVGELSLTATDKLWIDDVRVFPQVNARKLHLAIDVAGRGAAGGDGSIEIGGDVFNTGTPRSLDSKRISFHWKGRSETIEADYELGADCPVWDEFSPNLLRVTARLHCDGASDSFATTCGLREISTQGRRFLLNERPVLFRGTLECAIFPLTGYPPTDVAAWKRILTIARQYGLNHLRFHTWCPPEAAFVAADEMGFYYEVECSCWGRFGDGGPLDTWMPEEGRRMLRAYGNHPSFVLMAATNEPKGQKGWDFLANVISAWKKDDPRRLYTAGAGAGQVNYPASDFHIEYATRFHQANGELSRSPQTTEDYRAFVEKQPLPCIAHELGQWCVYPDFDEIAKFSGVVFAGNLEIFRDFLNRSGLGSYDREFVAASGKFQTLLYKAEIEKVLRTPEMGGFELLDLHDFPGQGTSPVGVLDEFWESKGYVTPEEYRRFAGPSVLLARLGARTFTSDQSAEVPLEISHFAATDIRDGTLCWRIRDMNSNVLASTIVHLPVVRSGELTALTTVVLPLSKLPAPAQYRLEADIEGTQIANTWDFWVYPPMVDIATPQNVTIAHDLSESTLSAVADGGTCLVLLPAKQVAGNTYGAFEPIFWNRILFPRQLNHTLGIFCDPHHPLLAEFPTEKHSNWQWWDLQQNCKPMVLDGLPSELVPVVRMIDDWTLCRRLGLIVECRLGKGRLVVCSIDLETDLSRRPVARQLLHSLLSYISSVEFSPRTMVTAEQLRTLAISESK
jgi:hypothetical protein